MMMRSTSMTSTSGVTLMSDFGPPFEPPVSIAMANLQRVASGFSRTIDGPLEGGRYSGFLRRLLDEVVHELRRRVVHLDVEVLDAAGEVVVEPHRRNRHEQPERGLDERFCNTGRHGADTTRAGRRDAGERVNNADDRAKQSDERCCCTDGRERADALLQVVGGECGRALNRAAHRVEQLLTAEAAGVLLLELIFLKPGEHDFGEVAVAIVLVGRDGDGV